MDQKERAKRVDTVSFSKFVSLFLFEELALVMPLSPGGDSSESDWRYLIPSRSSTKAFLSVDIFEYT